MQALEGVRDGFRWTDRVVSSSFQIPYRQLIEGVPEYLPEDRTDNYDGKSQSDVPHKIADADIIVEEFEMGL